MEAPVVASIQAEADRLSHVDDRLSIHSGDEVPVVPRLDETDRSDVHEIIDDA